MDYKFANDLLGNPFATCDLEYEALGDWLTNDLADDFVQIEHLISISDNLQKRHVSHHQHDGKIYHLVLENDEVELFLNHSETTHPEFIDHIPEDNHPVCGCGLVDFQHLLNAWLDFIQPQRSTN